MRPARRWLVGFTILGLVAAGGCMAAATLRSPTPAAMARTAVHGAPRARQHAIASLRALGPSGLEALLAGDDAGAVRAGRLDARTDALLREAVDRVASQKDALASGLYWYSDLDVAKHAAASSGRPILSLRLLGNLDEDLSCANSRFFRTTLYPDERIARALREQFVLHWSSVRPVPRVSVDFGDGRKLETTITGNSIHYVLTPGGAVVDALPGLSGSRAFLDDLARAGSLAREVAGLPDAERHARLAAWHDARLRVLTEEFANDQERAGIPPEARSPLPFDRSREPSILAPGNFLSYPSGSKLGAEMPIMGALVPGVRPMRGEIDDATWTALARLHEDECRLDERSRALARSKEQRRRSPRTSVVAPSDGAPTERASSAGTPSDTRDLEPLFRNLERSIAEDTVRNRYMLHAQLHAWLANDSAPPDIEALNERVYRDLFHSPANDAWLGLVPPDTYRALDGAGESM